FDEGSLLSRLNRNLTDSVDRHIVYCLRLADSIGALSDGRYDVTVKPLVEAWGFAGKERAAEPDIDSLLEFVGREKVAVRDGRLIKADARVQLDFNSVAKGYTVDLLARLVERFGAQNYLVDIGGEVRCRGVNRQGGPWRIGVETPFDGNMTDGEYVQKRVRLSDGGLATSGNYRRFYIDSEGRKVAHTIDPRTGRSAVSRLLSVTVAAPTCAEADALGTMFLAMGADDALAAARRMPGVKVYFILAGADDYEEYVSPAMQELIMN
ncbi:MAG: FAD:protein FMN transferase, partial [Alistipes sp.]|nr:FAD:protein FMN transferase [Alistipes sp.]